MDIKKGLRKYSNLNREEYFKKNDELSKDLWPKQDLPTVADIASYMKYGENDNMQKVFDFFDNKEDFDNMINKNQRKYQEDESNGFIRKVMASNNKDIAEAGYFYKLLMSSTDDFVLSDEICNSNGHKIKLDDEFDESKFNFYVKSMYVNEIGDYVRGYYDEFFDKYSQLKGLKEITVRSPMYCEFAKDHKVCSICEGIIPNDVHNIGTFTTLGVTEFATQGALSSMNKGLSLNINEIVQTSGKGITEWDDALSWIQDNLDNLSGGNVQSRFYEVAYLSRIRKDLDNDGKIFISALKSSINHSGNLFGAYIFSSSVNNLTRMLEVGEFEDNSTKLKIAVNGYGDK